MRARNVGSDSYTLPPLVLLYQVGGILVAVAGATVTAFGAIGHASAVGLDSGTVVTGNVLLISNKLCIAVYPLLEKRLFSRGYSPIFVVAWGYVTGSILTLLAVIPCTLSAQAWVVPASGWVAILYAGCLSSGFNYAAMAYVRLAAPAEYCTFNPHPCRCQVNKRTSPVLVMSFYPAQSFFTPMLSYIFLGSVVSPEEGVGGGVIIIGKAARAESSVLSAHTLPSIRQASSQLQPPSGLRECTAQHLHTLQTRPLTVHQWGRR